MNSKLHAALSRRHVAFAAAILAACVAVPAALAEEGKSQVQTEEAWWIVLAPKDVLRRGIQLSDTPLTTRALDRRALRSSQATLLSAADLPITQSRIDALKGTGAELRTTSRWLNLASVQVTSDELKSIAKLPFVRGMFPVRHSQRLSVIDFAQAEIGGVAGSGAMSDPQLAQIGVDELHARGFHGAGMVVGILDTGFERSHIGFASIEHPLDVIAEWDFVKNDGNTAMQAGDDSSQHWHGSAILGTLASYLPGVLLGSAYEAKFVLAKTEDVSSETPIEEDYYVAGIEFVEAHGADIATSSLGYIDWYTPEQLNGVTCVTSRAVNVATSLGMICLTAAGNQGNDSDPSTNHLLAPADALQVISCGAVDITGAATWFTSDGPSADGRVKPEVLACGLGVYSIDPNDPAGFISVSGTSLSTPLVAGAVTLILQARPSYSVMSMRSALTSTASDAILNGTFDPMYIRGFGIMDALAAASIDRAVEDLNLDGSVGAADLASLLNSWGACSGLCPADFNGDDVVGAADLAALLNAWN